MGCPFAQLSPLLLLSCLVLFFQFGASFFSPKPVLASLQRGRSLTGKGERAGRGGQRALARGCRRGLEWKGGGGGFQKQMVHQNVSID